MDGDKLGHGLPRRQIPLNELRAILLHPATSKPSQDDIWRQLIQLSRLHGEAWTVGCVGVAMPGLRRKFQPAQPG